MRVAVVFHEGQRLGAGVVLQRLLPGLADTGAEAHAFFAGEGPLVAEVEPVVASVTSSTSPIAFSAHGWRAPPGLAPRLARTAPHLRRFGRWLRRVRPDVVYANTLLSLPEALMARALGFPVVMHVHELPPPSRKRDLTLGACLGCSRRVIAVSDAVAAMLDDVGGAAAITRIHNGVPDHPASVGRSDGRLRVGALGTSSRRKGTDVLLAAARLVTTTVADVDFLHRGPVDLDADVAFRAAVREGLGAMPPGRFEFLGPGDPRAFLGGIDVLVMPSREDPFPLATLEAMASGLPVIATRVGGIPEQIEDEVTGVIVEPGSADGLAGAILRLRQDEPLRRRLGDAGRVRVRSAFSIERQVAAVHRELVLASTQPASGP